MRVFPRIKQFVCFHFEFSLAYGNVNLCSGITLVLVFQYTITLIQNSVFPYRRINIQNTHFPWAHDFTNTVDLSSIQVSLIVAMFQILSSSDVLLHFFSAYKVVTFAIFFAFSWLTCCVCTKKQETLLEFRKAKCTILKKLTSEQALPTRGDILNESARGCSTHKNEWILDIQ